MGKSKVSRIYFSYPTFEVLFTNSSVIRFDFQCWITDQDFISSSYLFILRNSIILDSRVVSKIVRAARDAAIH